MKSFAKIWCEAILAGKQNIDAYSLVYAYEKSISERQKKKNGVFYTPTYIIDYMVSNTITLEKIQKQAKFLDPACGSGAFLLGAFSHILDFYKLQNLPTEAKKELVEKHIFGIDIDQEAVYVTKLVLFLKILEGENDAIRKQEIANFSPALFLKNNILIGNALIDFAHWDNSFDVVIGNPPYVRIQTLTENQSVEVLEYYKNKYISGKSGNFDLYTLFTEKGYTLLNDNGILAFIEPHKFFQADFGEGLREFLVTNNALQKIVHFGAQQVFKNATTYTCLLFLDKQNNTHFELINVPKISEWAENYTQSIISKVNLPILGEKWNFTDDKKQDVLNKIFQKSERLEQVTSKIFQGIPTGSDKIFVLEARKVKKKTILCFSQALNKEIEIETSLLKPFLLGKEVKRYEINEPKYYVIFPYNLISNVATLMTEDYIAKNFPLGYAYLLENKSALENRENQRFIKTWWQYSRPQNLVNFAQEKIIVPDIANKPQFTLDNGNYHTTTIYSLLFDNNISEDKLYWLAFLNSKLMWFFMGYSGSILRGGFLRFKTEYLKPFPVKRIDFTNKIESQIHNNIIITAQNLLDSYIDLKNTNISNLRVNIEHKINGLENQINHWIFDLYNLDEIERELILQS